MKIAVDAMGGDFAPKAVIDGVAIALTEYDFFEKLVLVGDTDQVTEELRKHGLEKHPKLELVHAASVVEMHESATLALRGKKDSSITVCTDLVKKGEVDAVVSAGHTGAAVAASVVKMRTLPGVDRPGIATVFPTPHGQFVLLDAGANVDSNSDNLVQFAQMGEIYAKAILKIDKPRIGLLANGEEESKGNELTKEAHKKLKDVDFNFVGNVEGGDLFGGEVDVVVCDGFVGNVVLKSCEHLAKALGSILKQKLTASPVRKAGAFLARNAFSELKKVGDYAEYGGAPLLGVNGICIIGHGSSSPKAIKNAIRVAGEFVENKVNEQIVERLKSDEG